MLATLALTLILRVQTPLATEVTFQGAGGLQLRGTFLAPAATGKFPAVLLVPGSGPTDRDGNQRPGLISDLLRDIAQELVKTGIASLRFDKRAVAATYKSQWPTDPDAYNRFMDFDNFVEDARAAYEFLGTQP